MRGYWRQPVLTATALRGGWMHTGDVGYFDSDGYLYVVDRVKDMIVSGGENVYSTEVENAIASHPDVAQCAVIGIPDEKWGEAVHAIVVPRAGSRVDTSLLDQHCRGLIASPPLPPCPPWLRARMPMARLPEVVIILRQHRLPAGSDLGLRRVNLTDWMMRTAQDEDVNSCFGGNSAACAKAASRYPEYVQLQFQRCRTSGQPAGCMQKAVRDARKKGYLISAYTRSNIEKQRNREYRRTIERVNERVGTIVSNNVSNAVSNAVSTSVNNAVSAATSRAASHAASSAASAAAARAARNAASTAAANAAARAAANAASNIRVPSDMRLKTDIVPITHTRDGFQLYRYRYIGDDTFYVGVMAQDIARQVPAAVSVADDGYLQVNYGLLGIAFLTYSDWMRSNAIPN